MAGLNPREHDLGPSQRERIFREKIVARELTVATPSVSPRPQAWLLGGQPAAGKSSLIDTALHSQMSRATVVGTDGLRLYHPCYRRLLKGRACRLHSLGASFKTADFFTDFDARLWVDSALDHLMALRSDILLDGTLSRPDAASALFGKLSRANYSTKVIFVATPRAISLLGNLDRYVRQRKGQAGRICSRENHDRAYESVLVTAQRLDDEALVDIVSVDARTGENLYLNRSLSGNIWLHVPPRTVEKMSAERSRVRTPSEATQFIALFHELRALLEAEDPEWREWFDNIREAARAILNDDDYDLFFEGVPS